MSAFLEGAQTGKITVQNVETVKAAKRKMQSQILLEMIAIDREWCVHVFRALKYAYGHAQCNRNDESLG